MWNPPVLCFLNKIYRELYAKPKVNIKTVYTTHDYYGLAPLPSFYYNGKSFDDAIKEYVAANGSLFGVSNQNIQGQEMTIPSAPAPTQVAANPAQNIQGQQVVPNTTTQNVVQPMNLQQNSSVTTTQFNTTNVAGASSIGNTNNIDSQVNDFLKQRGLIK